MLVLEIFKKKISKFYPKRTWLTILYDIKYYANFYLTKLLIITLSISKGTKVSVKHEKLSKELFGQITQEDVTNQSSVN